MKVIRSIATAPFDSACDADAVAVVAGDQMPQLPAGGKVLLRYAAGADDVVQLEARLKEITSRHGPVVSGLFITGVTSGGMLGAASGVHRLIEVSRGPEASNVLVLDSAAAIVSLRQITQGDVPVSFVAFDDRAYFAGVGADPASVPGDAATYVRGRVVVESVASGAWPCICYPPVGISRPAAAADRRAVFAHLRRIGFKGVIGAAGDWIPDANAEMAPPPDLVDFAVRVRSEFGRLVADGRASGRIGDRMIDKASDEWARAFLEWDAAANYRDPTTRPEETSASTGDGMSREDKP
jgi:citrate lyase beta subunit